MVLDVGDGGFWMERGRKGLVGGGFGWRRVGAVMEVVRRKLGLAGAFFWMRGVCRVDTR